jgi:sodium/bile acid cotransporter 7
VAGVWRGVTPAQVLWLLAVDATILALVLTSTGYIAGRLGFSPPNRIVIIFCGSMKSIATGIPMAAVLFAHRDIGLIVLPAMLLHQMQLVICAVLARRRPR